MRHNQWYAALILGLGLGLTLILLWLLPGQTYTARADPRIRYVAMDGVDNGSCDSIANRCRTVQAAINAAVPLDEIRVAAGTFSSAGGTVAAITKSVKLLGGWSSSFTIRDPGAYRSTLDAGGNGRVVYISGHISPTIDGFIIRGGNATSENMDAGLGGGIYSKDASPIIQNNIIASNTASISPTNGSGGGIYLYSAPASSIISGNRVLSNTAHSASWDQGGGGLFLSYSDATVQGNLIQGNTSDRAGGGIYVGCCGAPRIFDNIIRSNESDANGGGIYSRYMSLPHIEGNLIISNTAGSYGGAIIALDSEPTIIANRILSNTSDAAGVVLETNRYYTVTNNLVAHNSRGGIRVWDGTQYGLVAHNTVVFNPGSDGGIRLAVGYITPTVLNNIVVSNTYGIWADINATGTLDYNDVWGNTTLDYELPGALEPGPHDIHADPLFVRPAEDNYYLQGSSPCIDAGTDAGVTTDIDGEARPNGAKPDIGADEYLCNALTEVSIAGPTTGITDTATTFIAAVSPPTATLLVAYIWQASGQAPITHPFRRLSDTATFSWTIAATHTVTVTAVNCGGSDVATHEIAIRSQQYGVYLPLVVKQWP